MSSKRSYDIANIDLSDDYYTIEQSLFRNKYKVTDSEGEVVLKGKQKMLKMKEEFPFVDEDGEEVFTELKGGCPRPKPWEEAVNTTPLTAAKHSI